MGGCWLAFWKEELILSVSITARHALFKRGQLVSTNWPRFSLLWFPDIDQGQIFYIGQFSLIACKIMAPFSLSAIFQAGMVKHLNN